MTTLIDGGRPRDRRVATPNPSELDTPAFDLNDAKSATLAVRAGQQRGPEGEHGDPIYTTSSFVFESAAAAKGRFVDGEDGNVYSRFTNPTVRTFEDRLAALEGARFGHGTASGMAAILTLVLATLKAGDHVILASSLFGSTITLFKSILLRFGVSSSFVPLTDLEAWRGAVTANTRLLFIESPTNPLCEVGDIRALARIAHDAGARLVVDNCFCTPVLQKPIELGADVVVHSATKYLDGQGRCVGGAIVHNDEELAGAIVSVLRSAGPAMSPFNAWVFLKGLETLAIRLRAHSESAARLASWLDAHPAVARVFYPGLASHPQHRLAVEQQTGFGGIVAFEVEGGLDAAWSVVDATRIASITANFGDAKTTITHPATTTHGRLSPEDRELAGISESLIRVSVGLEDIEDIVADLDHGLSAIAKSKVGTHELKSA